MADLRDGVRHFPFQEQTLTVIEYTRPQLYPKQEEAFFCAERYSAIEASTKAGKTVAAIAWIIEQALSGPPNSNYWWIAPVSDQANIAYTRVKNGLPQGAFTPLASPTPRIFLPNSTIIWFKSGDNADSLYGEDVFAAVIDEGSRVKEEAWHAVRSTLTSTQGPIRIIGNVKGRKNWFYRLARMAEAGEPNMKYMKITVLDAIAAGVIPQSEMEDARRVLPEHVFRELYMAEPSDDGGNPFGIKHIAACVGRLSDAPPVAFGIDLAKKQDYTVIIGLDSSGRVCLFQRWQGKPWRDTIREIQALVGEDVPALVDSTGIGDPVLEELQHEHGNFKGYMFSSVGKQRLMEGLAISIHGHEITYPAGIIAAELESFEYEVRPSGTRYSAPEGMHDDCVCALALAREQWSTGAPAKNLMDFYLGQAEEEKARREKESILEIESIYDAHERRNLPDKVAVLDNELTELYNSTLQSYGRAETLCFRCRQVVDDSTRVSDGLHFWHVGCH